MYFSTAAALATVGLAQTGLSAIIKISAQAVYDNVDPFEFSPAEVNAEVGDILEFHFAGTGGGVLGGNHSVAQGMFGSPCEPAPGGFFSGYMPVNATSFEAVSIP